MKVFNPQSFDPSPTLNRMVPIPSQILLVSYQSSNLQVTLDTGATVSYIRLSDAKRLRLTFMPNDQLALLADEKTRMASLGEVDFLVHVNKNIVLRIRALIMKNLQAPCFGGTTFHADNDITARIKTGEVLIHNKFLVKQSNPVIDFPLFPPPSPQYNDNQSSAPSIYHAPSKDHLPPLATNQQTKFNAISLPSAHVVLSGDTLQIPLPANFTHLRYIGINPSFPSIPDKVTDSLHWLPQVCEVDGGHALYKNVSKDPITTPKYAHFRTQPVNYFNLEDITSPVDKSERFKPIPQLARLNTRKVHHSFVPKTSQAQIERIQINKSVLSTDQLDKLNWIHKTNYRVFDNDLTQGYNHHAGQFYATFTFTTKPPPTKVFVPQYNKRCASIQQAKCDELESQGVLVDPKTYGIPVLHVSPSWIQQKGRAKHKELEDCTLDELRFITAFNTLNDSIRPQPSRSCTSSTIFTFLARWKYHIFGDLNNSYFQLPVQKSLWCYLGIMTPHKGVRVMTRAGQGLLGSDVELEELLCRVLGDYIDAGHCVALRDDIIIGGNSVDEALSNYEKVLLKLNDNNLKLSPGKVRIFPSDTEIYGYRIKDGCIEPSPHIVKSLGLSSVESLTTVKKVNSWKGLYKCLIGHLPALAMVMSPFDTATGGRNSSESFSWSPQLISAFNVAMSHLQKINKTYLPAPSEQLLLLPDTMSVLPCTGWVMYTQRDSKMLPVTYCSAKLKPYMVRWFPCEKEAVGTVLAIEHCSHWISESDLTTLVGPDSSAVVQATELMRKGKHSSSPRLQSLLASINRRNVKFFHNSAKSGKHIVPDSLSRLKDTSCKSKDCAVERFLDDIPLQLESMSSTLLSISLEDPLLPAIIAATSTELSELLTSKSGPIPLGSRRTWIDIQKSDPDCNAVFKQKSSGDLPRKKKTNSDINKIFKASIIHQGLLVVRAFDDKKMREVDKVVIPPTYLDSVLTVLHIKLNHPTQFQLKQVFERHFFSPKLENALNALYQGCHICISLQKFPKELETFSPSLFPDHPGTHMNIDVMRRAGQYILVNIDLFSGFVTSCLINSETAEDLSKGIMSAVTPIRHAEVVIVRVDKAPALVSLAKNQTSDLNKLGIRLELSMDDNKNSNCCVDKAIAELECELKKLSPLGAKISSLEISQATTLVNNKIRNRGLTAAEIHFSRASYDNDNLALDDSKLRADRIFQRFSNHGPSSKSKTPGGHRQTNPDIQEGDIVYVKNHGSKHHLREPHIVVKNSGESAVLKKALHTTAQDGKALILAPSNRTVAKKFIYRPSYTPRIRHVYNSDPSQEIPTSPSHHPIKTEDWHPIIYDQDLMFSQTYEALSVEDILNIPLPESASENSINLNSSGEELEDDPNEAVPDETANGEETGEIPYENHDIEDLVGGQIHHQSSSNESSPDSLGGSDQEQQLILFNRGEGLFEEEKLDQSRPLKKNIKIAFYDEIIGGWKKACITSNPSNRKGWKDWFNYVDEAGIEGGGFFKRDERWTIVTDGIDDMAVFGAIPQVDGTDIPDSATPDTTPEKENEQILTFAIGTRSKIRLDPSQYLSSTSDSDAESHHTPGLNDALDWDNYGTALECDDHPLTHRPEISLDQVSNLDSILPLTSTPAPASSPLSRARKTRVSAPRRLLPEEIDRKETTFLSKLNPFRKKE